MRRLTTYGIPTTVLVLVWAVSAAWAQDDVVMKAMRDEMARSSQLQFQNMEKPYFIAYRIDDINHTVVSATLGSLTGTNPGQRRILGVEVRVGDYALDNTNYFSMRSFTGGRGGMFSGISQAPLDDNYQEVRRGLWLTTDAQYKKAIEDLSAKRAALQNRKRGEDITDFSKEQPATLREARVDAKAEVRALEQLTREVSLPFKPMPDVTTSSVEIDFRNTYTRYLNSEGTSFTRSLPLLKLTISAETQTADGLPLQDSIELYGRSTADLPAKEELVARARDLGLRLEKLRQAASMDRYNGPVLFEDRAAAEIFAQVFAPGLVVSRPPTSDDPRFEMFFNQMLAQMGGGANFLDKIGGRVLPDSVNLTDSPRLQEYAGTKLAGVCSIDDDGVPSRETKLVEKGILKAVLASRIPVKSIAHSTGSRRGFGPAPSNLVFTAEKTSTSAELRQELLRRVKLRGLDYGIVVRRVGGGGTGSFLRMAARMAASPQAAPSSALLEVYKVFPDGHEEPLRGMELVDMTAAMFRDILAVGDKPVVHNEQFMPKVTSFFSMGMAASSDLPVVSFVVPSLLFEEVTLSKVAGPFPNPPVTKAPLFDH